MNEKYTEDFNIALNVYERDYSHYELMEFLKSGCVAEKQTAVLKLDKIENKYEAEILINNLTGCDGKIREAVSFRLKEFMKDNVEYYTEFYEVFLDAVVDINGNICRNTLDALDEMQPDLVFVGNFCNVLVPRVKDLAKKAKDFDIQDGKYKINKEIFKLYWYLEAVYRFLRFIDADEIFGILSDTKQVKDYTIREKTAKIH